MIVLQVALVALFFLYCRAIYRIDKLEDQLAAKPLVPTVSPVMRDLLTKLAKAQGITDPREIEAMVKECAERAERNRRSRIVMWGKL